MKPAFNSEDKAAPTAISFLNKSRKNSPRARLTITVRSYPKYTCAISETFKISDAEKLSEHLARRRCDPIASSLYCSGSYYLCLTLKTTEVLKILPAICEHSERVFLGRSYETFIKEHSYPLIRENALEQLISE